MSISNLKYEVIKSGICKTGGRYMVVIDKAEPLSSRIDLLASCLNRMDLDNVYLMPAIRSILESHKKSAIKNETEGRGN